MRGMNRNQKGNYNEILLLSSYRNMKETTSPIAKRLMDNKYKVCYWNILEDIVLSCPPDASWRKISKYLTNCNQIEFDKFFELRKKTRDLRFEKFLSITNNSKSSGYELLVFYKNLVLWEPRLIKKGRKENHNNYEKIKRLIKNNPSVELTGLGYVFNSEKYSTNYTNKLID